MASKYNINSLFTILLFLLPFSYCFSQNVEFEKDNFSKEKKKEFFAARDNLEKADKLLEKGFGKESEALPLYLKAQEFNPNNALLNYKIGNCYLKTYEKSKSIPYFEKAYELNPKIKPDLILQLAGAYQLNYDFDKAINKYTEANQFLTPQERWDEKKGDLITKRIAECNNAKEIVEKKVRCFIDNIGSTVNSKFPDYCPIVNADESVLVLTSRRDNTNGGKIDEQIGQYYEDIYITTKKDNNWTTPINPSKPLNTDYHDAAVGMSSDGQKLLIYYDDNKNGGDIYESTLKGNEWSKRKNLGPNINTAYHESVASYSPDGRTLYFVSNKPGGIGGHDIYMSQKVITGKRRGVVTEEWGPATNLGNVVNTPYDEQGVFMAPDGKTLYFSSKGHNNIGGYDIFKSTYTESGWSEPENLGYPINTTDDDVFFSISANGKHGYYASGKAGGSGDLDIYMITFLGPEKPRFDNNEDNLLALITEPVRETVWEPKQANVAKKLTILKGITIDEVTLQPVGASIELTDNAKNLNIATFESNSTTGKYLVVLNPGKNYGIAVQAEGYLFHSENFDIPDTAKYNEINQTIKLKKIAIGSKIILRNIFFDFDKATLRPESTAELERLINLLNDLPKLKIEISGHTDNKGTAEYNKKLSESRAKAVVDYLINHKIDAARLQFAGYGFDQPYTSNDTDEGRQLNRRTEFKIISN